MPDGLIIDLFAGAGGASCGIRSALGREVDIAVNHDENALLMHAANHPGCLHLREDVFEVDLEARVAGRTVDLMWASPSCTNFSRARAGKPRDEQQRVLSWAVHRHASVLMPRLILMENVEEIALWEEYGAFVVAMRDLGYSFETRILRASDYGARTSRTRWFAVLRSDGSGAAWPRVTNGDDLLSMGLPRPNPVRDVLDLSDWGENVAERRRPLSEKTMRRIERGRARYGDLWVMSYYGTGVGQSIDAPLRTITCKDRFAIVRTQPGEGTFMRMLKPEELKLAQGFPKSYVIDRFPDGRTVTKAEQTAKIGNSVVPIMARKIVEANVAA